MVGAGIIDCDNLRASGHITTIVFYLVDLCYNQGQVPPITRPN